MQSHPGRPPRATARPSGGRLEVRRGHTSGSRRGSGVVWAVVLVFLLSMASLGFAMRAVVGQATLQAQRDSCGELALAAAESALDEAGLALTRLANDPAAADDARSLFLRLRMGFVTPRPWTGPGGGELAGFAPRDRIARVEVPVTRGEMADGGAFRYCTLVGGAVEARLETLRAAIGANEESAGTVRLTASVSQKVAGGEVLRTVSVVRPFQVTLLSTPRPFDQATLWVADPISIIRSPADHDRLLGNARAGVLQIRQDLLNLVDNARQAGAPAAQIRDLQQLVDRARAQIREPAAIDGGTIPPHYFPASFTVLSVKPQLDLGELDLHGRVQEYVRVRLLPAAQRYEAALTRVNRMQSTSPTDPSLLAAIQALVDSMQAAAIAQGGLIDLYGEWQTTFRVMPGRTVDAVNQHRQKLSYAALADRATFRFARDDSRGSGAERLRAMLAASAGREERALHGVLVLAEPDPLVLADLKVHGRIVIVTRGAVTLSNVTLAGPRDLLTVASEGKVTLDGTVQASLVLGPGARLATRPGVKLTGNLIFDDASFEGPLAGTLANPDFDEGTSRGRYHSGHARAERWDYQSFLLGPVVTAKELGRRR